MAQKDRPRFPLRFPIETGAYIPGEHEPFNAKEYRIEVDRDYDVVYYPSGKRKRLGSCRVEGPSGNFVVAPNFELTPQLSAAIFSPVWRVGDDGIARLHDVLLRVG